MDHRKIALISNRFLPNDLRGSEEIAKQLLFLLRDKFRIDLLTSDVINLQPLTSPLSKRIGTSSYKLGETISVYRFKSYPLISSTAYALNLILSKTLKLGSSNQKILVDFLKVIGWGPLTPGIYKNIIESEYDLVFGSAFPSTPSYIGLKAALRANTPFIYSPYLHYRISDLIQNKLLQTMVRKSSAVIALTESEKKQLIKLGSNKNSTFVISPPYKIDASAESRMSREKAKKRLGLENRFIILTNPHPLKGGIQSLEAAALLSDIHSGTTIVSMGNPKNSYLRQSAYLQAKHKNLKVINMGWIDDTTLKQLVYTAADVYSMPSITDSFGLQYLDSWASKTPVIGANDTSSEDLIKHAVDGFLVPFGEARDLFTYFRLLLERPDLQNVMGNSGYEKVKKLCDPVLIKEKYISVFESVIK
jgi:glycosyltransferase involved in cell wall biosynthesis